MTPEAIAAAGFTPTERRILTMLADGFAHTRAELRSCSDDELSSLKAIQMAVSRLRKKIGPGGLGIVCVLDGGIKYRMVQFVGGRGE
jgi:hypothetical protein